MSNGLKPGNGFSGVALVLFESAIFYHSFLYKKRSKIAFGLFIREVKIIRFLDGNDNIFKHIAKVMENYGSLRIESETGQEIIEYKAV